MIQTASALCRIFLVGAMVFTFAACEEDIPPQPQPPAPTATNPEPQTPSNATVQTTAGGSMPQGGGSALGNAKRSATNLADQIDNQQRDLLREMGEEPPPPATDDE